MNTMGELESPARQRARVSQEYQTAQVRVSLFSEWGSGALEHVSTSRSHRQFMFVYSGTGSIVLDGSAFPLCPGNIIAAPSGTVCVFRAEPKCEGIVLEIDESYFRSQVIPALPGVMRNDDAKWDFYYTPMVFGELTGEENAACRREIMRELMNAQKRIGCGVDQAAIAYMLVVLFEPNLVERQHPGQQSPTVTTQMSARGLVMEFRSLIEQNVSRHLRVNDYCALLNVTPRRLSYACELALGLKPLSLIHERLALEATRELMISKRSISQIAYQLGFEDSAYFSRFVKRHTGRSPSDYKR
jgi:AraC family transcriptional regulator, transcriptional activator of pobA